MKNRRFEDRFGAEGIIQIVGHHENGGAFTIDGAVSDYSVEGLGVRTPSPIAVFTAVSVIVGKDVFIGEIRYCRKSPFGHYALGIKIPRLH